MPKELTTWVSKTTARKGWIKFATPTHVKICFRKGSLDHYKVHSREDFMRLYEKEKPKA